MDFSRFDAAAKDIANGVENVQDRSAISDNFIFKDIFIAIMNRWKLDTEFRELCYLSFFFLLRTQSEGLPAKRASNSERLPDRSIPSAHSLIGLRSVGCEDRLVLKLIKQKIGKFFHFNETLLLRWKCN